MSPIILGASTSKFCHLVTEKDKGYYVFRSDLTKDKNKDIYAITNLMFDKNISASITIAYLNLIQGANGTILLFRLNKHLFDIKMDFHVWKSFENTLAISDPFLKNTPQDK